MKTETDTATAPAPFTIAVVTKKEHTFTPALAVETMDHTDRRAAAVVAALCSDAWDFAPYPKCTPAQLQQVDVFFLALGTTTTTTTTQDPATAPPVMGVVGVVWVPLSPGPTSITAARGGGRGRGAAAAATGCAGRPVEGYVQLVLVAPPYRQQHVASRLLSCCLSLTSFVAAGGKRASSSGEEGCVVRRWRLHTMQKIYVPPSPMPPSPSLSQEGEKRRKMETRSAGGGDGVEDASAAEPNGETVRKEIESIKQFYIKHGFTERRYLRNYYGKHKDAVEMVKTL